MNGQTSNDGQRKEGDDVLWWPGDLNYRLVNLLLIIYERTARELIKNFLHSGKVEMWVAWAGPGDHQDISVSVEGV